MKLTNDDMETLNRSTEILSRFADVGAIKRETFDLFEQMIVSAIDAPESNDIKHRSIAESPYSRLLLSHIVGFYEEDNKSSFFADASIVNVCITNDLLSLEIRNSDLGNRFSKITDFSFAPVLVMTKDNNDKTAYIRIGDTDAGTEYQIEKCKAVNAPYITSLPIVFECTVQKIEGKYIPELSAKIYRVNVLETAIDGDAEFDICKAWARMIWKKHNNA